MQEKDKVRQVIILQGIKYVTDKKADELIAIYKNRSRMIDTAEGFAVYPFSKTISVKKCSPLLKLKGQCQLISLI
ncbi:hypothetical protein LIT32_17155 [Bacillus sp. CMF21]|uniref:hypothetical protein n=1 Tax=Metabacillus dongyingensis TaxID=2874282 RepID=UPI001CBCC9D0|nr:hypothetical protein [Metabacillus dongyingensis]UAL50929.1 hypothetical protein K8L98_17060 [Metabacillus dongyingensis]UOK56954.1 hypothetical protein MGI18_19775 [Bacillus sp. OVS6]USK27205.1 hypothetical protein LIT32_17155 [Bacillus sp. CMF21]